MKYPKLILLTFFLSAACTYASPLSAYDGAKMAMGIFFDHSGQDLYKTAAAPSILNTTGAKLSYAPFKYLNFGGYLGAAEFDHLSSGDSGQVFNSNFSFTWGGTGNLFSPGFFADKVCLFLSSSAGLVKAEDENDNLRELWEYHNILGFQYRAFKSLNIGAGLEIFYLDGTQSNNQIKNVPFGNSDNFRGIFAMEFYPKTNHDLVQGQPFIGVTFRFTGAAGLEDELGLKNSAVSISIGLISDYLYGKNKPVKKKLIE